MPVYEYQCQTCQLVFEARQKFSDAPLTACTSCGGSVKKLISQTGFALKGSGWYQRPSPVRR
jgi:putative FmdB family regulatory protein